MDNNIDLYKYALSNYDKWSTCKKSKSNNYFIYKFKRRLEEFDIPYGITHLIFVKEYNKPLNKYIPNSVTHITFGNWFNQSLKEGQIPNSVTHLTFGRNFNQPLKKGDIPNSVTHLTFGWYNQEIEEGVIPDSVTHLNFGKFFHESLNDKNLPKNLIELIFFNDYYFLNFLNTDKNILIGISNGSVIEYKNFDVKINIKNKIILNKFIEENCTKDKIIGPIIFKELIGKVFHYDRVFKISKQYNIDVADLFEIY
jgi:hypothetical protein